MENKENKETEKSKSNTYIGTLILVVIIILAILNIPACRNLIASLYPDSIKLTELLITHKCGAESTKNLAIQIFEENHPLFNKNSQFYNDNSNLNNFSYIGDRLYSIAMIDPITTDYNENIDKYFCKGQIVININDNQGEETINCPIEYTSQITDDSKQYVEENLQATKNIWGFDNINCKITEYHPKKQVISPKATNSNDKGDTNTTTKSTTMVNSLNTPEEKADKDIEDIENEILN